MSSTRAGFFIVAAATAIAAAPSVGHAQTGKWTATVPNMSIRGSADLTIEPRNEKQARAKLVLRNAPNDRQVAWDIVVGRCGNDGQPIAPQATFRQVRTGLDGQGEATSNIPVLDPAKQYYLRVFDPATPASDRGAFGCANLSEKP